MFAWSRCAGHVLAWLTRNLAVTPSLASVTWTIEIAHADPALALDPVYTVGEQIAALRQHVLRLPQAG